MLETAVVVLALALVACAAWIVRLAAERARLAAERDVARRHAEDVERNAGQLKDSFGALAHEALQKNTEQLVRLNRETLEARAGAAVAEMEKRKAAVDLLLQPIGEALKKTQEELRKIEGERTSAYAGLKTQVSEIQRTNEALRGETARLVQALSKPNVRGRYGEIQLQRVAEVAGMRAYCDFTLQDAVRDADGRLLKPDMVVRMPGDRMIAVDAKTNLDSYLEALKAQTPEQAEAHLTRFATHVVEQVRALSRKGYWKELSRAPDFVVMFIPGDQFIDAALERRPELIELAAENNVVLASPSTLIGVLRAVQISWQEHQLSERGQQIYTLGTELHDRMRKALELVERVGGAIDATAKRYNELIGSLSGRVMPTLRKIEDAGVALDEAQRIAEPRQIEAALRDMPGEAGPKPPALPDRVATDAARGAR